MLHIDKDGPSGKHIQRRTANPDAERAGARPSLVEDAAPWDRGRGVRLQSADQRVDLVLGQTAQCQCSALLFDRQLRGRAAIDLAGAEAFVESIQKALEGRRWGVIAAEAEAALCSSCT